MKEKTVLEKLKALLLIMFISYISIFLVGVDEVYCSSFNLRIIDRQKIKVNFKKMSELCILVGFGSSTIHFHLLFVFKVAIINKLDLNFVLFYFF
jgi:hypothetical protein